MEDPVCACLRIQSPNTVTIMKIPDFQCFKGQKYMILGDPWPPSPFSYARASLTRILKNQGFIQKLCQPNFGIFTKKVIKRGYLNNRSFSKFTTCAFSLSGSPNILTILGIGTLVWVVLGNITGFWAKVLSMLLIRCSIVDSWLYAKILVLWLKAFWRFFSWVDMSSNLVST